jgi:hypothetical protein
MKNKNRYAILIVITWLFITSQSWAQENFQGLSRLVNAIKFEMPSSFGDPNSIEYTFIHAGCYCSISQATTGNKENSNSITTFSFNLADIKDGILLVSKPKGSDFKSISEDIWTLEIGTLNILVQNTDWQSRQTKTNHFYLHVEGIKIRDQIIEYLKKSTVECGGSISEVSILN